MQVTMDTVQAMEQTNKVMQATMKTMNIDKIADMMDDQQDLMMDMEEINDMMGRNYQVLLSARKKLTWY